jgi:hypothetical protein
VHSPKLTLSVWVTHLGIIHVIIVCFIKNVPSKTYAKPGRKLKKLYIVKTQTSAFGRMQHGSLERLPGCLTEELLQRCKGNREFLFFLYMEYWVMV